MRHSTVICHNCGKVMVPRTRYSRSFFGYAPSGNHCPFCLSENWDGSAPSLGMRLFGLLGLGLGILLAILVGAAVFKLQALMGLEGQYPLLSLLTLAVSVYLGYRFYFWFLAWDRRE